MNLLTERGAVVRVYDPIAMGNMRRLHPDAPVAFAESEADLAQGCDAVVVVTDWPQFQHLDLEEIRDAMRGDLIVDARNMLHRSDVEQLSLRYIGIGR